jgi:hypothetical protein
MTTPIFNQSISFFDVSSASNTGLIPLQSDPAGPLVSGVDRATNMLLPDAPTMQQLRNFPEDLYDLRDTSRLVRLLKVLLGDAGAGQLRKRTMITRLESALSGANFYDLDRFYGAIFGALRQPSEALPINPMDDTATPDEWDAILAADASYRERIAELAKAIAMGGTVPGLQQVAEALVQAPVDVYESWQLLDSYGSIVLAPANTWNDVQTLFPTWGSFAPSDTWNRVEGTIEVGRTNTLTRSEIVVRPRKDYSSSPDRASDYARDENALVRVLQRLRPAGTIITVDSGLGVPHVAQPISGLQADSEYWEIAPKVQPKGSINGGVITVYPISIISIIRGIDPGTRRIIPRPPFAGVQGTSWSYNTLLSATTSYSFPASDTLDFAEPQDGTPSPLTDDQLVVYRDGTEVRYTAKKGTLGAQQALASAVVSDGALVAHPYTGDRKAVPVHE